MKRYLSLLLCIVICFSTCNIEIFASDYERVTNEVQRIGDEELEITEKKYDNYKQIIVKSSDGDLASYDTRNNYILENGNKIGFSLQIEEDPSDIVPMKLSDWRQIRSYTMTIKMEKALDRMTVSAITAFIRGKGLVLKIGKGATFVAKRLYTRYREKSLKGKKAFYVKTVVYGYIYTISREAYKKFYQDINKKTIPDTTTYSDSAIKGK